MSTHYSSARFRPTPHRLALPTAVDRRRIVWSYAMTVGLYHLVAVLAVLPWFFSWAGLVLAVVGVYVFGGLGINLCYHRLLTHRGLACPKWLEYRLRHPWRVLHAGHAGTLGGGSPAASRAL